MTASCAPVAGDVGLRAERVKCLRTAERAGNAVQACAQVVLSPPTQDYQAAVFVNQVG